MHTHRSILYRETGKKNYAHANILTRGTDTRLPITLTDTTTSVMYVDVHCGQFWVSDMPDLTRHNEAYLEITVVASRKAGKQIVKVPYQFKLQLEIDDNSFSTNLAGSEILSRIQIEGNGLEFHCRLTELDKVEPKVFQNIQGFLEKSDIASIVKTLLTMPNLSLIPVTQLFNFFNNTSEMIDELNDDDRLWLERPKLDLRPGSSHPLYEGWYAFVDEDDHSNKEVPYHLFEMNGELFKSYNSSTDNDHLNDHTYFTWQMIMGNETY